MNIALWILGIVVFLLIVSISIAAHEAGHMIVAKKLGLKVPKYFVGFGKTLWSTKKGSGEDETEYGIKMLPLGGFVQIYDPSVKDEKDPERELLSNVAPWKRISVFSAGPIVNLVIGFVMFISLFMMVDTVVPTTTVGSLMTCEADESCSAQEAGILPNDKLLEIDGKKVPANADIQSHLKDKEEVNVLVERNGEEKLFPVKVVDNKIGVYLKLESRKQNLPEAVSSFNDFIAMNVNAIISIPSKVVPTVKVIGGAERDEDSLSSIVAAGQLYGETTADQEIETTNKIKQLFLYTALINLSLGMINLLPIGILDGGRIFIAGIDSVRLNFSKIYKKWSYKPLGVKWVEAILSVPSVALFGFMILLVIADIVNPVF